LLPKHLKQLPLVAFGAVGVVLVGLLIPSGMVYDLGTWGWVKIYGPLGPGHKQP
jgi:hypothetical protein